MFKPVTRRMAKILSASWDYTVPEDSKPDISFITLESPVFDISGYASSTRSLIKGLIELGIKPAIQPRWFKGAVDIKPYASKSISNNHIVIQDRYNNRYNYLLWINTQEAEKVFPLIHNNQQQKYFIIHMAPHSYGRDHFYTAVNKNQGYETYIGSTMFETDRLPADWVNACNNMDLVWVPTTFNVNTFSNSGVDTDKLRKVPLGVDTSVCRPGIYPKNNLWKDQFVLLSIFEWNRRKGWDILIKAFCLAFNHNDQVVLIIRSSATPKQNIKRIISNYIKEEKLSNNLASKIVIIDDKLDIASLYSLYETCDVFVLPSRGEGWGIPYLEAMAIGKPVIGTNWGGNTEFMTKDNSFLIEIEKEEYVTEKDLKDNICFLKGHKWAKPSLDHLIELLRSVYENTTLRDTIANKGLSDAHEKWSHINYARSALRSINLE